MGCPRRPVHERGAGRGHDVATQARRPAGDRDRAALRLPAGWLTRVRMGPRRRTWLALAVVAVAGYLSHWIFQSGHRAFGCASPPARALNLCTTFTGYRPVARWAIVGLLALLAVGVVLALTRWALNPIRALTATVSRLGPQNLGERVPVAGDTDEATVLAVELNRMMDRLAAGYEGQRSFAANASHELRTPLAVQRALIEVGMS